MIIGDIKGWEFEQNGFSPRLQKAIEYIQGSDLINQGAGRYEIDGENMFAVVQEIETAAKSDRKAECHSKFIDVQYLISGEEEVIGVARQSEENIIFEDELKTKDYMLYENVKGEFDITLKPGMFAVFFPSDIHRPGCSRIGNTRIKKVVVKVNKNIL